MKVNITLTLIVIFNISFLFDIKADEGNQQLKNSGDILLKKIQLKLSQEKLFDSNKKISIKAYPSYSILNTVSQKKYFLKIYKLSQT